MIKLKNVTVSRFGKELFTDLNLTLESGVHYIIEGRNGAGKTTLLELIAGKWHPKKGTVEYDFIDRHLDWDQRHLLRQEYVHYIPANALFALLGNQPDLFYQQRYYSMGGESIPRVRDFFGEDIARLESLNFPQSFNVQRLLNLELTRLSNGQIKKTVIIRQLLKTIPKVLLFDYPFEGLDKQSCAELSAFIDHLAAAHGIQIVLTDQHHRLPNAISKRILLRDFHIESLSDLNQWHGYDVEGLEIPVTKTKTNEIPIIEMKAVTIQYGETKVIENLNWTVNKGERWTLTGKNGSGKTTLFSIIYADHPLAYSQNVSLFGKRRGTGESIWDIKNRISYLGPEQTHFIDSKSLFLTVHDFIRRKNPGNAAKLEELFYFFDVNHLRDRIVSQVSQGELQLIQLILFFLEDRELLLLDEPFVFLDSINRSRVIRYLSEHMNASTTMVMISHDDIALGHRLNIGSH